MPAIGALDMSKIRADTADLVYDPSLAAERHMGVLSAPFTNWGGVYLGAGAVKDEFGYVHLFGTLRIPTTEGDAQAMPIFTLPVGMRPNITKRMFTHSSTGTAPGARIMGHVIQVGTDGVVTSSTHVFFMATGVDKYLTLDGLKFPASDSAAAWPSGQGIPGYSGLNFKTITSQNWGNRFNDDFLGQADFQTLWYIDNAGPDIIKRPDGMCFFDESSFFTAQVAGNTTNGYLYSTDGTLAGAHQIPDAFWPSRFVFLPVLFHTGAQWGWGRLLIMENGYVGIFDAIPSSWPVGTQFYVGGQCWSADRGLSFPRLGQAEGNKPLPQGYMPPTVAYFAQNLLNGWQEETNPNYIGRRTRSDEWNYISYKGVLWGGTAPPIEAASTGVTVGIGNRILTVSSLAAGSYAHFRRVDLVQATSRMLVGASTSASDSSETSNGFVSLDGIYVPRFI